MAASIAIAGLGITEMGKVYGKSASDFAADAIALALADAGLGAADVDGLLVHSNLSPEMTVNLQWSLGFHDLPVLAAIGAYGSTPAAMFNYATRVIEAGQAQSVVMVYADAPLRPAGSAGAAYANANPPEGMDSVNVAHGFYGANVGYSLAAKRHMELFGTTSEQFGAVAVAQREWALMNPHAQMRAPITLEDHQASRWIVEPLHLLDCCLVSNGAVAVVVTSSERAKDLKQVPVHVLGMGQFAPGDSKRSNREPGIYTGATEAGRQAFQEANVTIDDFDFLEIYDCYTYTVLVTLEDYGFCKKGEGGAFVADGKLGPGGALPTNTGGGQLSSYYMWGFTPLSEAIIQLRGQAGERQVKNHDLTLVSGNGGFLNFHGTLVLSTRESA